MFCGKMIFNRLARLFVFSILAPLAAGCGGSKGENKRLVGGGSSFIAPLMKKWSAVLGQTGFEIDYTSSGSGNGVQLMIDRKNVFGCTDAPMSKDQLTKAGGAEKVVHIPLAMGAVVPIYNLEKVSAPLNFTGEVLAGIYLGKVKKWNDPVLASINPGVSLPDLPIEIVYRADGSGTSFIWTDYLSSVSAEWKGKAGVSTQPKWPAPGQGAAKNPGVAQAVAGTPGAIGYVELSYALENPSLRYGQVQNAEKSAFVKATLASIVSAGASIKGIPDDLCFSLVSAPGKDSYPICGTVWLVAFKDLPAADAAGLKKFLQWALAEGQSYSTALHYGKLPENLASLAVKKAAAIQPGR
ncbi:MAG: phosphate ABC transporter substrate-binding protein PstS [Gemmataceae bacterium]|nr:phosphate ABC transporter substrate-binding protein PstS [Gemmataceae bacterium]